MQVVKLPSIGLAIVAFSVCLAGSGQDIRDVRYRDVALQDIARSPKDFDQPLVRVRGVCQIEYEANSLWVDGDALRAGSVVSSS
jgi:hypothetical protein